MLRAEIDGDEVQWRKYLDEYRAEGGCLEIMQVAFYMLTQRRFGRVKDLRDVMRFVNRINHLAPPEEQLPPREAEAILRRALGEPHIAATVDDQAAGNITYALFFVLVDDLQLAPAAVDRLLLGAEQIITQVERSGAPLPFRVDTGSAVVIGPDKMQRRLPKD